MHAPIARLQAHAAHAGSIPVEFALMMPFVLIAEAVVQMELLPPAAPFAALHALQQGGMNAACLSMFQCLHIALRAQCLSLCKADMSADRCIH